MSRESYVSENVVRAAGTPDDRIPDHLHAVQPPENVTIPKDTFERMCSGQAQPKVPLRQLFGDPFPNVSAFDIEALLLVSPVTADVLPEGSSGLLRRSYAARMHVHGLERQQCCAHVSLLELTHQYDN